MKRKKYKKYVLHTWKKKIPEMKPNDGLIASLLLLLYR